MLTTPTNPAASPVQSPAEGAGLNEEWAAELLGFQRGIHFAATGLELDKFSQYNKDRIAMVLKGARAALESQAQPKAAEAHEPVAVLHVDEAGRARCEFLSHSLGAGSHPLVPVHPQPKGTAVTWRPLGWSAILNSRLTKYPWAVSRPQDSQSNAEGCAKQWRKDYSDQFFVTVAQVYAKEGAESQAPAPAQGTVLPDGSAFMVGSLPLPTDHWLYAERIYMDGHDDPVELPTPVTTHADRDRVEAAIRYAVRGAMNRGKEMDFDPDALVQNAVYALCGPFGGRTIVEPAQPAKPSPAVAHAQPMSAEQMVKLWGQVEGTRNGYGPLIRAVERHHGIGVSDVPVQGSGS